MTDAEILLELWKERAERQERQIEKLKALVVKLNAEKTALQDAIKTDGELMNAADPLPCRLCDCTEKRACERCMGCISSKERTGFRIQGKEKNNG